MWTYTCTINLPTQMHTNSLYETIISDLTKFQSSIQKCTWSQSHVEVSQWANRSPLNHITTECREHFLELIQIRLVEKQESRGQKNLTIVEKPKNIWCFSPQCNYSARMSNSLVIRNSHKFPGVPQITEANTGKEANHPSTVMVKTSNTTITYVAVFGPSRSKF